MPIMLRVNMDGWMKSALTWQIVNMWLDFIGQKNVAAKEHYCTHIALTSKTVMEVPIQLLSEMDG